MKASILRLFLGAIMAGASVLPSSSQTQTTPQSTSQPTSDLPAYLVVIGKTTDRAKIGAYAASLPPIYATHGGYYAAIGGVGRGVTWLEGPLADRSLVLARYPSRAAIDAFWWGEPYRAAVRKRDNAGVFSVFALPADSDFQAQGADKGYLIVMTALKNNTAPQVQASLAAARAFQQNVTASGGIIVSASDATRFTTLEGDSVFDRIIIAAWPSLSAREAYLTSQNARRTSRLRQELGLSVVVSINGVPRSQGPTAATTPAQ